MKAATRNRETLAHLGQLGRQHFWLTLFARKANVNLATRNFVLMRKRRLSWKAERTILVRVIR